MNTLFLLLVAMRPKQWTKNALVFAAPIFARRLSHPPSVLLDLATFALFCLLSGSIYLVNDVVDVGADRQHPRKCRRPVASGKLSPRMALAAAAILAPLAVMGCFLVNLNTGLVAVAYVGLTLAYDVLLKSVVIVDALAVSMGFVLRAVAGAEAIMVEISPWLLVCTFLLALFLSFAKRRQEMILLESDAHATRRTLQEYTPHLLDQLIAIVTACTVMAYCLYTISERTITQVGTRNLIYTIPFVIYGVFRYLYLIHRHGYGDAPDQVLLSDRPLLLTVALYVAAVVVILYLANDGAG